MCPELAETLAAAAESTDPLDVYLVAIGGTGMAPLACLLQDLGHRVRGVDGPLYPPMSTLLEEAGIEPLVGYDAAHLEEGPTPDVVVIGNAVPRTNPEAEAAERLRSRSRRETEVLSMPQALARFCLSGRRPLVVAGTHGKTTTSSMAAWTWSRCGRDPGYLVGGIPRNLGRSFSVGTGDRFVVEGDEYNAAYFDRGPKFLHYRPHVLILTSVEYDHADLYESHEDLLERYRELVRLVPEDGLVAACGDAPGVREVAAEAAAEILTYGLDPSNDVHPEGLERTPEGSRFRVPSYRSTGRELGSEGVVVDLPVPGEHNLQNALGVWAAARWDHLAAPQVAAALGAFREAKRRLEELGTAGGVTVVDDFAHHPTAVEKSIGGLGQRYPGRRLVVCFEPRSLSAGRDLFTEGYRSAFEGADVVFFAPVYHRERLEREERGVLDLDALAQHLRRQGVDVHTTGSIDELRGEVLDTARPGDVVATMSSGSFDGLPGRILEALAAR